MIKINNDVLLESNKEKYNIHFEVSKDNKKIIKVEYENKKVYLGSKYNVINDINNIVKFVDENIEENNIVIIGLATGEYIDLIYKYANEDRKILILEPNMEVYYKFINSYKNENPNLIVLQINNESMTDIKGIINKFSMEGFKIYEYPNYKRIYAFELREIYSFILDSSRESIIDRNTNIFFSRIWFECFIKNLKHLNEAKSIKMMKDIYKNKPAIIVSAGPSLSKNIKQLSQFKNKAVIITGGRTLKTLLDVGVEPDFFNIIDAQDLSYNLVKGVIDKVDTTLVHCEIIPNKVLQEHKGKRFFFPGTTYLSREFEDINFNATGSCVSHVCLSTALYMGCNPIIFVGQDLAYTNDRVHAENAEFREKELKHYEDLNKFSDSSIKYINDIYGNKVKSSNDLILSRMYFEKMIKENPNITFINSTEGGAHIEGTKVMNLIDNIKNINDNINLENTNEDGYDIKLDYKLIINKTKKCCNELIEMLDKAIKNNKIYYDKFINNGIVDNVALEVLENIDNKITTISEEFSFIEYLFAEIINSVLYSDEYKRKKSDTEKEIAEKLYRKGEYLYSRLKEELGYALKVIEDELTV